MKGGAPRSVRVIAAAGLRAQYRTFKKLFPEIAATVAVFNEKKRANPPGRLPASMKDHVLDGPLKGIRECHLAPDVLLLYTHVGDVVRMLYICQHDDLKGKRAKQLSSYIKGIM